MPAHIYKIAQQEFLDLVAANEDMTILDIRQASDYEAGHIRGAINAPWGTAVSDILSKLPADKPLFVYCYSGQTAGQAVHTLNLAGFDARSVNLGYVFGISTVPGYEEYVDTVAVEAGEEVTEISREIQTALDFYYAGLADLADTRYANYKISEDNLEAMINGEEDFYLLSIRSQSDYDAGHIEGAELLPWGNDMAAGFANLPKDKTIVVYCYSGQTAGQTVAALRLMGYDAVSLNGGFGVEANAPHGWTNHDKPVVQ
ncbi:rhodanese-like domain-containing protein [Clostridia bacterium]|nr:rhodanese-like domain-containing protein [Clostridia bacterium]